MDVENMRASVQSPDTAVYSTLDDNGHPRLHLSVSQQAVVTRVYNTGSDGIFTVQMAKRIITTYLPWL